MFCLSDNLIYIEFVSFSCNFVICKVFVNMEVVVFLKLVCICGCCLWKVWVDSGGWSMEVEVEVGLEICGVVGFGRWCGVCVMGWGWWCWGLMMGSM